MCPPNHKTMGPRAESSELATRLAYENAMPCRTRICKRWWMMRLKMACAPSLGSSAILFKDHRCHAFVKGLEVATVSLTISSALGLLFSEKLLGDC